MHGVDRSYRDGCRCEECRAWNAERVRRWRAGERKAHWWREMVHEAWWLATLAWEADLEATALGYETEGEEFRSENPPPQFKEFLKNFALRFQYEAA